MARAWWLRLKGNQGASDIMAVLRLGPSALYVAAGAVENNVDLGVAPALINRVRVDTTAGNSSFTGILPPPDGQLLWIINTGPNTLTLLEEDTASDEANRFFGIGDYVIPASDSLLIYWDININLEGRWVMGV